MSAPKRRVPSARVGTGRSVMALARVAVADDPVEGAVEVVEGEFVAAEDDLSVGAAGQAPLDARRRLVVLVADDVEVEVALRLGGGLRLGFVRWLAGDDGLHGAGFARGRAGEEL